MNLGNYRHYKGGHYTVLLVAKHSETDELLVVYRSKDTGDTKFRPYADFVSVVEVNGKKVNRFTYEDK